MLGRTVALAMGVMGAVAASQLPEFAQQYRQRLGGAIDELKRVVERFDADAGASGLSREQALGRLQSGPDDFVRRRGDSEAQTMTRLTRMEQHRDAMTEAGAFGRIGNLVRYADTELADRTLRDYEPAVPTTAEGAVVAGAGFVAGYGLIRVLTVPFRRRRRRTPASQEA